MTRFLDRLASLPVLFIAGACEAQIVMVPCPLPITAMAPVVFHAPSVKRVVHHRGGRRGVMHALHLVAHRPMCAVWSGGLDNGNLADFDHAFGGGEPYFGGGSDLGGDEGGGFGGFGGGGGSGSDTQPDLFLLTLDTPPTLDTPISVIPITPLTPIVPITPITVAAPESSTWFMVALGFVALGFLKWKRRLA